MDKKNLATVRQSFANTVFTHKVQEVAAERQDSYSFRVKIVNIIITGLILLLLFLQTKNPSNIVYTYFGVAVTIGDVLFLIVQLQFGYEQRMVTHKNSALKFLGLRDQYRELITDIMNENISKTEVKSRRNNLQKEYQILCELAPQTNGEDYTGAQKKLNIRGTVSGEEFTWSDKEIDRFLPEELHLKK